MTDLWTYVGTLSKYLYLTGLISIVLVILIKEIATRNMAPTLRAKRKTSLDRWMGYLGNVETEEDSGTKK